MQKIFIILRGVILALLIALGVMSIVSSGGSDDSSSDKWDKMVWDKDNWG